MTDEVERVKTGFSPDAVFVPPEIVKPGVTVNNASLSWLPFGAEAEMTNGNALPSENEVEM